MENQMKLPNINLNKIGKALEKATNSAVKFFDAHMVEFLAGLSLTAIADNIRVRLGREKDKKTFEQSATLQKEVARRHEAEINVLRAESKQAKEAIKKVDQLEQIVKNITEGGGFE